MPSEPTHLIWRALLASHAKELRFHLRLEGLRSLAEHAARVVRPVVVLVHQVRPHRVVADVFLTSGALAALAGVALPHAAKEGLGVAIVEAGRQRLHRCCITLKGAVIRRRLAGAVAALIVAVD